MIRPKPLFAAAIAALVSIGPASADGAQTAPAQPHAFLELFTSQGCAACPPADALLGELIREPGVIGLTMPTRLWDFLGWADTLATDALTKRQIAYATSLDSDVYTPQLIVNGKVSVVGSDSAAVLTAMDTTAGSLTLPISLEVDDGILSVDVGNADVGAREATLWLAVVTREVVVPVRDGENRGRDLVYHNVVRSLRPIGMWKGSAMELDLPLTDVERRKGAGCVVFAQADTFKGPSRVVGAAVLPDIFPARRVDVPVAQAAQ